MNSKQRYKNRQTARLLAHSIRLKRNSSHLCENCGDYGGHWIQTRGQSLFGVVNQVDDSEGFYTCAAKTTSLETFTEKVDDQDTAA